MKRSSALTGLLGLVLLSFGVIGYALTSGSFARFFIFVNLLGGAIAIIGWLVASWGQLGSIAGSRRTRYGANAAIYSLAFIGLLIAVNYIAARYPHRFDLTAEKVFSLSPQSDNVLKSLKRPLKMYGFVEGGRSPVAEALYNEYKYHSPEISYELVDPNKHPELAERFKVSTMNTTHLQYGGANGPGLNVTDMTENALTNGILKLTKTTSKTICFTYGEGEADPNDTRSPKGFGAFKQSLEGEDYQTERVNLSTVAKVPDACTALIVAGPTRPLLPHSIDLINSYIDHGGRALVMMRPQRPDKGIDETAMVNWLRQWGVSAGNDIVVDQVVRLFAGPALGLDPLVNTYAPHPITASFDKQTVFPMSRTVEPIADPKPGLKVVPLAKTSDTSWAETDLVALFDKQQASFGHGDVKGPVTVADVVDANLEQLGQGRGTARMVVFGDTDFADNQYLENFFNRDFIMNTVDWLSGEANSISIRPRTLRASRFELTIGEFDVVFVMSVLLLPELLLIIGIAVWYERRN